MALSGASASRTPRRAALPAPAALAFAERLDRLFRAAGDPSPEDTARAIYDGGGPTISASYLWLLRTGRKANPTLAHLTALAGHFGVPPAYFFDDALTAGTAGDVAGRAALGDLAVRALALAAAGDTGRRAGVGGRGPRRAGSGRGGRGRGESG